MKILMLGWELPPNNSGGLGVACLQLSKALANSGADIDFILPYSPEQNYDFMNVMSVQPSTVRHISQDHAYDSYKYVFDNGKVKHYGIIDQQYAYEKAVSELVQNREFDVIHAHDWLTFRAAMRAKAQTAKPLIVHVHSIERDRAGGHRGNPLVREIEETTMLMADRVIAVSGRVKQMIVDDYKIPPSKIEVIHNSIDKSYLDPLDGQNAYLYLTEIWRDAYSVADLFVMPSVSEPFGLTPLEAVMYGTPVLVSKQSGVAEVLSNCLKVDFWDEREIANQISAVLRYESLASELHDNSLQEVDKMSWKESATKLMQVYRSHFQETAA
jgi:glycosyltransferase involved in cell wall biosynthesis